MHKWFNIFRLRMAQNAQLIHYYKRSVFTVFIVLLIKFEIKNEKPLKQQECDSDVIFIAKCVYFFKFIHVSIFFLVDSSADVFFSGF